MGLSFNIYRAEDVLGMQIQRYNSIRYGEKTAKRLSMYTWLRKATRLIYKLSSTYARLR